MFTKCCLHKDFNLDIELPKNRLCPTLPLRLNYIHFIEDLLKHCDITKDIIGVDIGAGASCIYCLLAVRVNKDWKMYALEMDQENIKFARENIIRNQLTEEVMIVDQEDSNQIFEKLFKKSQSQKSFCLCNPPFFSSDLEMIEGENRTGKRPKLQLERPSHETVTEGGELTFVTKILVESIELKDKIQLYSTMLGCKRNFESFVSLIKGRQIDNFTTTRFIQGKVHRWAVAWSFCKDIKSFKDHLYKDPPKTVTVLKHVIENKKISNLVEEVKKILSDLKIGIKIVTEREEKLYNWELKATENTWSNQRRKRRAQNRSEDLSALSNQQQSCLKMGLEIIKRDEDNILLKMHFISGSMSKDSVNQILQYIKNKLSLTVK